MKVKELVAKLKELDQEDLIVINVTHDYGEITTHDVKVDGECGWDDVVELSLGELISG